MSLLRWATAVALLVALVVVAGCGGDDDSDDGGGSEAVEERIEAKPFAAAFRKETGLKLESDESSTWVTLDPGTSSDAYGEFGAFTIYVLRSVDEGLEILTDDDKGKQIEADADGFYWHKPSGGGWSVTKVFAGNVVISWQAGDQKKTDDRYDRLAAAVEKAAAAAGS